MLGTQEVAAGLDGVEHKLSASGPVNKNIFTMSEREKRRHKIKQLPGDLDQALDNLEKDKVLQEALGEHIYTHFLAAKRQEWADYISHGHPWEQQRYLSEF